jgi:hypothetical protein
MASAGTIDFKIDTAAFVAKLRQDFNLSQAIANPKNIVQVTGLAGSSHPPKRTVVIAQTYEQACHAADRCGLGRNEFDYVTTGSAYDARIRGRRLTMEDCIFAPGYHHGRYYAEVERELHMVIEDMPDGQIVDFEDDR